MCAWILVEILSWLYQRDPGTWFSILLWGNSLGLTLFFFICVILFGSVCAAAEHEATDFRQHTNTHTHACTHEQALWTYRYLWIISQKSSGFECCFSFHRSGLLCVILFTLLVIKLLNSWGIISPTDQLSIVENCFYCSSVNPSVCELRKRRNKTTNIL